MLRDACVVVEKSKTDINEILLIMENDVSWYILVPFGYVVSI